MSGNEEKGILLEFGGMESKYLAKLMVMTNGQEITTQLHYEMSTLFRGEEIGAPSEEFLWRLGWGSCC